MENKFTKFIILMLMIIFILSVFNLLDNCEQNPDDCVSQNPKKYGVFKEDVFVDSYTDSNLINEERIEEIRKEIIDMNPDCENLRFTIINNQNSTELIFKGDCYVSHFFDEWSRGVR